MKKWYSVVCDEHKEYCDCFVHNTYHMMNYLKDQEGELICWLNIHEACDLKLAYTDEQIDKLHENGYSRIILEEK